MPTPEPRMHRCALCSGRGYRQRHEYAGRGTVGYTTRTSTCKRCGGTGQHPDRKIKTKPLAATEIE